MTILIQSSLVILMHRIEGREGGQTHQFTQSSIAAGKLTNNCDYFTGRTRSAIN